MAATRRNIEPITLMQLTAHGIKSLIENFEILCEAQGLTEREKLQTLQQAARMMSLEAEIIRLVLESRQALPS